MSARPRPVPVTDPATGPATVPVTVPVTGSAPVLAAVLAALLIGLAGCGSGTAGSGSAGGASSPPVRVSAPPTTSVDSPPPPAQPDPVPAPVLVLRADGLEVGADDEVRQLVFRQSSEAAVREALAALGQVRAVDLPDCPRGPRTALQVDGLQVLLDGGRFVGWTESGSPERNATTMESIGLQSSLAELREAFGEVALERRPAGAAWRADVGLSGLLDGTAPTSRVIEISGGETCPTR